MERASEDHFGRASLRHEHIHRYQLAAQLASKVVVDCACGIGYGSDIISSKNAVDSYLGIDPSQEAIEYARGHYSRDHVRFEIGSLEFNSLAASSVDSFLMFETLEHTESPLAALESVRRCLKPDGLLMGSVPSAEYEDLCSITYGLNPFHRQKFTKTYLTELLCGQFEEVLVFSMEFLLGSLLRPIGGENVGILEVVTATTKHEDDINGSIIFVAGSSGAVSNAQKILGGISRFFPSIPKVILDRDEVNPIRSAMQSMEALIREQDEAIAGQARMLEERWTAMQSMEALIRERDEAIAGQARMLEERWTTVQSMEALIRERDEAISEQRELLEKQPTTGEAMHTLLLSVKASVQHRIGLFLGERR